MIDLLGLSVPRLRIVAVTVVLALAGCGVNAEYVQTARSPHPMRPKASAGDVQVWFGQKPERQFVEVGLIEVQQEKMNDASAEELVSMMREVAGEKGCDGIVMTGANDGVASTGLSSGGAGSVEVHTLKGYRATCIVFTDGGVRSPPQGAGGFVFGSDAATAQASCTGRQLQWSQIGPSRFSCSGTPSPVGIASAPELAFCAERLCEIRLSARTQGSTLAEWMAEFSGLHKAIEGKYGFATNVEGREPKDCQTDAEACSDSGQNSRIVRWVWPSGETIALSLLTTQTRTGELTKRNSQIGIVYERRAAAKKTPAAPTPSYDGL